MVWAADFNYQQEAASSQEFVKAYTAEYGEDPLNYAAEAYDAAWFLAKCDQGGRLAPTGPSIKDAHGRPWRRSRSTVPSVRT